MRYVGWIVAVVLVGCPAAESTAVDAGADARAELDAGRDSGTTLDAGQDSGIDSGVDSGPACGCIGVSPCCPDGCNPASAATECSSVNGPQDCYPDSYIAPGWRGWDETVTHCNGAGACTGTTSVIMHRYSCPDGCARDLPINQSYCL